MRKNFARASKKRERINFCSSLWFIYWTIFLSSLSFACSIARSLYHMYSENFLIHNNLWLVPKFLPKKYFHTMWMRKDEDTYIYRNPTHWKRKIRSRAIFEKHSSAHLLLFLRLQFECISTTVLVHSFFRKVICIWLLGRMQLHYHVHACINVSFLFHSH